MNTKEIKKEMEYLRQKHEEYLGLSEEADIHGADTTPYQLAMGNVIQKMWSLEEKLKKIKAMETGTDAEATEKYRFTEKSVIDTTADYEIIERYGILENNGNLYIAADVTSVDGHGYTGAITKLTPHKRQMLRDIINTAEKRIAPICKNETGLFVRDGEMAEMIALYNNKDLYDLLSEPFDDVEQDFSYLLAEIECYDEIFTWEYTPGSKYIHLIVKEVSQEIIEIATISFPIELIK